MNKGLIQTSENVNGKVKVKRKLCGGCANIEPSNESEKKGSGPLLAYTNIDGLRTNGEGQ
jgi:hypothetical protein